MLVLSRRVVRETVVLGDRMIATVLEIGGNHVRLGIETARVPRFYAENCRDGSFNFRLASALNRSQGWIGAERTFA